MKPMKEMVAGEYYQNSGFDIKSWCCKEVPLSGALRATVSQGAMCVSLIDINGVKYDVFLSGNFDITGCFKHLPNHKKPKKMTVAEVAKALNHPVEIVEG